MKRTELQSRSIRVCIGKTLWIWIKRKELHGNLASFSTIDDTIHVVLAPKDKEHKQEASRPIKNPTRQFICTGAKKLYLFSSVHLTVSRLDLSGCVQFSEVNAIIGINTWLLNHFKRWRYTMLLILWLMKTRTFSGARPKDIMHTGQGTIADPACWNPGLDLRTIPPLFRMDLFTGLSTGLMLLVDSY